MNRFALFCATFAAVLLFYALSTNAQVNVLTYHYNNSRTGDNLSETNRLLPT